MTAFVDTSVLVAAFWGDHAGHDSSNALIARARRETWGCGLHSLAELYATLTAMPIRPAPGPEQVVLFVEQIPERLTILSLTETEYRRTIRDAAEQGMTSGRIFDALLLACARKFQAKTIYTWNLKHFRQLAPDLADRIRMPSAGH
jgi:predicted nucleic acid-binding protein